MSSEVPSPRGRRRNIPSRYWTGPVTVWVFISIFIYVYSLAFVFLHAGDKISFFSIGFTVLHTAGIHSRNSYVIHLHVSPLLQVHSASLRTSVVWFARVSRTRTRDTAERRPTDSDADATRRRPGPPALHHVPRRARGAWRVRSVRHCPHAARLPLRRRGRRSARDRGPRARVSRRRAASPAAGPRVPIALTIVRLATSFEFGCGTAVGSGSARAGMTSPHPSRDRWAHAAGHTRVTCRSSALHLPFRASRIPAPLASQARVPSSSLALSEVSS
jgi:hypothetical protein